MPDDFLFRGKSFEEYTYWQEQDSKTLEKVNRLLADIRRNGYKGIGKPEPLKHSQGKWSRRIDKENRIILPNRRRHGIHLCLPPPLRRLRKEPPNAPPCHI